MGLTYRWRPGWRGPTAQFTTTTGSAGLTPVGYSGRTLTVGSYYFDLAWIVANLVLILLAYAALRGVIKLIGIIRLSRRGGLRVGRYLKGRGGVAVALALIGVGITVVALFLPWYSVTASSATGPFSGPNAVSLMSVDGVHGLSVNLFTGPNADSTSGLTSFASAQFPFAIFIAVGLVLLMLDIIGVKKGSTLGRKFIFGAITSLLPFVLIYIFVAYLPNLVPLASSLIGQAPPSNVTDLVGTIGASPIGGTATSTFPVVGSTTISWGFGIGAYLFLAAAVIRIVAGFISRSSPSLEPTQMTAPVPLPPAPA